MKLAARLVLLAALAFAGPAAAHSRGTSYSDWTLTADGAQVKARVSMLELTRLALDPAGEGYARQVAGLLQDSLQLWSDGARCEAGAFTASAGDDGWVTARGTYICAAAGERAIRTTLFQGVAPSHLHFARVTFADGSVRERVLTYADPAFAVGEPPDLSASFVRYVKLGIGHILSGPDHMAFVLALILLASTLTEVALVATGFTIAHSLTLAAAVLGVASVQPAAIEALIGFSIALVAAENLWLRSGRERWMPWLLTVILGLLAALGATRLPFAVLGGLALFTACYFALAERTHLASAGVIDQELRPPAFAHGASRLRVAVAFIFGLVHGFGFAGALTELRLPTERLAAALVGFNTGVECGQLLVILAAWPLLKLLARKPGARALTGDSVSACLCALGTFWFVTRSFQ